MNKVFTLLAFASVAFLLNTGNVSAQADTSSAPPPPKPAQHNLGFDVIIKFDGEIINGLVTEVGPQYILYKRTDIPDGPIYSIPRNEVYAINYRNQVKDYLNNNSNINNNNANIDGQSPIGFDNSNNNNNNAFPNINYRYPILQNGTAFVGLGFIRGFTKIKDVDNYSTKSSAPSFLIGYDANFRNNLRLGLQMGFGGRTFENTAFSSYDSTINNTTLKENVFALYLYARYSILQTTSRFQPYIMGGLGITSSRVRSENLISFTNDNSQQILVKSGARSAGIGIMARIGTQYYINNQFQAFLDAGVGMSVLTAGISVNLR